MDNLIIQFFPASSHRKFHCACKSHWKITLSVWNLVSGTSKVGLTHELALKDCNMLQIKLIESIYTVKQLRLCRVNPNALKTVDYLYIHQTNKIVDYVHIHHKVIHKKFLIMSQLQII